MNNTYSTHPKDHGPTPCVTNVTSTTMCNTAFRAALWTGHHLQMTIMSIPPCSDIGLEIHEHTDQIIRIEQGRGFLKMGTSKNNLNCQKEFCTGDTIFIPSGTWHNIINCEKNPLKLSSIYGPPQHPAGIIECSK